MDHSAHVMGALSGSSIGLVASLFVAGLAGSFAHCATMCGPFVLAQTAPGDGKSGAPALVRGALVPYHLGRATTYTFLGALAGALGGGIATATAFRPLLAGFLLLAAALFIVQALKGLGLVRIAVSADGLSARVGARLARFAGPVLRRRRGLGGYVLGTALGFLPCGLLYSALAAAAGSGDAATGALAMAAFALATAPALVVIGCVGTALAQRWRAGARALIPPLQALNAAALVFLAFHGMGAAAH